MRVISGKYRGRKLMSAEGVEIRPTSDMIKEAVFNILQTVIADSAVLDLFSGSGALGIEALSRGAGFVTFNDKSPEAIKMTEKNLSFADEKNYELILGDYSNTLSRLRGRKFDIVFIDPPYNSDYYDTALKLIGEYDILNEGGRIIAEHDSKKTFINLPENIIIKNIKKYGNKSITILESI